MKIINNSAFIYKFINFIIYMLKYWKITKSILSTLVKLSFFSFLYSSSWISVSLSFYIYCIFEWYYFVCWFKHYSTFFKFFFSSFKNLFYNFFIYFNLNSSSILEYSFNHWKICSKHFYCLILSKFYCEEFSIILYWPFFIKHDIFL